MHPQAKNDISGKHGSREEFSHKLQKEHGQVDRLILDVFRSMDNVFLSCPVCSALL